MGITAIAVGAALALPATAMADPTYSAEANTSTLTGKTKGAETDITLTVPAGFDSCGTLMVVTGTLTKQDVLDSVGDESIFDGHELVSTLDQARMIAGSSRFRVR